MEQRSNLVTFSEMDRQARNSEELLLACLYACAHLTGHVSKIEWPDPSTASAWISRLQGPRIGPTPGIAMRCLGLLDLSLCILHIKDFYGANLSGSNLEGSELYYTRFNNADLSNANLRRTMLSGCDFEQCDLNNADLTDAKLDTKEQVLEAGVRGKYTGKPSYPRQLTRVPEQRGGEVVRSRKKT
jgi:uncharacterized protein YjbI with pentapeptide repeats